MADCGDGVLPQEFLRRDQGAEIARARTQVAMGQLVPRPGESLCELVRVLVEALGNRRIGGVYLQGEVRGQHEGCVTLGRVVGIGHSTSACTVLRLPLLRTGWALGQLPFIAEQVLEEVVTPLRWRRSPGAFQTAGDGVAVIAAAQAVLPA